MTTTKKNKYLIITYISWVFLVDCYCCSSLSSLLSSSSHLIFFSAYLWGSRRCHRFYPPFSRGGGCHWSQSQLSLWARAGYILDELPAHRRALTDGRQGAHKVPAAHWEQFWGSVSCSRILRHIAQFHPRGDGIWASDLPITSRAVLPTELQPPHLLLSVPIPLLIPYPAFIQFNTLVLTYREVKRTAPSYLLASVHGSTPQLNHCAPLPLHI